MATLAAPLCREPLATKRTAGPLRLPHMDSLLQTQQPLKTIKAQLHRRQKNLMLMYFSLKFYGMTNTRDGLEEEEGFLEAPCHFYGPPFPEPLGG